MEWVVIVVLLYARAAEAFDVEEGAVEEFQLIPGMVGPLRQTCHW